MGRYEVAVDRIMNLSGGDFQALSCRYVKYKYHIDYENWYGMSPGTTTPVTGHPDGFLVLPNGHMFFIECGHVGDKSKALVKLQHDISECLDYESTHPQVDIDKIICCYSFGRMSPEEVSKLKRLDPKDRIVLIGPDTLAEDCVTRFPWLANEYLDMSSGNGVIVDFVAFLERCRTNAFAPSLDHNLECRDEEAKSLARIVEENKAVLVTGPSGSGKTKLVLEVLRKLALEHDAYLYVIPPSRSELYKDIQACCIGEEDTYLFLDDANDLAHISTIVNLVNSKQNVHVVATARSYAKKWVSQELKAVQHYDEYELNALSDDSVDWILKEQFGIEYSMARRRITAIAKGNLRIACFASDLVRGDSSINLRTIKEVFDAAYERQLGALSEDEKTAIAIASLLGPHRTDCNPELDGLLARFDMSSERYVTACRNLYKHELMDATPEFEAVSFEEQNLCDYFLRHAIVELRKVTIDSVWTSPRGQRKAVLISQRIADVFSDEETIEELRRQALRLLHMVDGIEKLDVVIAFGSELGIEGIACVGELLCQVAPVEQAQLEALDCRPLVKRTRKGHFDSKELSALSRFIDDSKCWEMALDLVFEMIRRECISIDDLCELFTWSLNEVVQRDSPIIDRSIRVLDSLEEGDLFQDDTLRSLCLIMFVRGFLMDERMDAISVDEAHFSTRHVKLVCSQELLDLRERGLRSLANLYRHSFMRRSIAEIVLAYTGAKQGDRQLVEHTYKLIAAVFMPIIKATTFDECEKVAGFMERLQHLGIEETKVPSMLNLSKAQELAITLSTDVFRNPDYLVNAVEKALELSVSDWQEFFGLLDEPEQEIKHGYQLNELIDELMKDDRVDDRTRETLARGAVSKTAPSAVLPVGPIIQFYCKSYGYGAARVHLEQDCRRWIGVWLASYDSYLLEQCIGLDISQMIESLHQYDEVLPFASVCMAERLSSGFMGEYLRELTSYFASNRIPYPLYLPYDLEEFNSLTDGILAGEGTKESLSQLASILVSKEQITPNGEVIARIVEIHPASMPRMLEALITDNNAEAMRKFVIHLLVTRGVDYCFDVLENSMPEEKYYSDWSHQRELVLTVLVEARNAGYEIQTNEWIVRRGLNKASSLQSIVLDVIPSLDYEWRRNICRELAKNDASQEVYGKAAFGYPYVGVSWRGSELPLLRERLEYYKSVRQDLLSGSGLRYLRIVNSRITALENEIAKVQVDEFVDPILHRRSNRA